MYASIYQAFVGLNFRLWSLLYRTTPRTERARVEKDN